MSSSALLKFSTSLFADETWSASYSLNREMSPSELILIYLSFSYCCFACLCMSSTLLMFSKSLLRPSFSTLSSSFDLSSFSIWFCISRTSTSICLMASSFCWSSIVFLPISYSILYICSANLLKWSSCSRRVCFVRFNSPSTDIRRLFSFFSWCMAASWAFRLSLVSCKSDTFMLSWVICCCRSSPWDLW